MPIAMVPKGALEPPRDSPPPPQEGDDLRARRRTAHKGLLVEKPSCRGGLQHKNVVHPALRDPREAGCVAHWLCGQSRGGFKSPLRHHHHVSSHHRCRSGDLNRRGALTNRKKRAMHGSPSAPSRAAKAVALDGRRLRRANPPFGTISPPLPRLPHRRLPGG